MKKLVKIIVLSLLLISGGAAKAQGFIAGLDDRYEGLVVIKSSTMTEINDSLFLNIEIVINRNAVQNHAAMRITPKLVADENYMLFSDMIIQGRKKNNSYERWLRTMSKREKHEYVAPQILLNVDSDTDTTFVYSVKIPYEIWMDDAILAVNQELISYNDKRSVVVFALDGRVKLAPRKPYSIQPQVNYVEPIAEQKKRKKQGQAFLDFPIAKSVIIPTYRRNPEELDKIKHSFDEIVSNSDVQINGLFIEGYASPDGNYVINDRLSRERAIAFRDYIVKNYEIPLNASQINVSWIAEDWDGVKAQVEGSDIAQKDIILRIINETDNIEQRKAKLQVLASGAVYRTLLQDMFPQLRRVEYQIDFSVCDFTVDQTKKQLNNTALLSHLELFRAAQTYDHSSRDFESIILEKAPHLFPDDPIAFINAAAVMIERGEYLSAKRLLEKYSNHPMSCNNLGVILMMNGQLDEAQELLEKALNAGINEAKHNLNELKNKQVDNAAMERYKNR